MRVASWLWRRVQHAVNSSVEQLIVFGLVGLALVVWTLFRSHWSDSVSVPTWLVVIVIAVAVAVIVIQALRLRARKRDVEVHAMMAAYAEHLGEILYAFQRAIGGQIPGVTFRQLIEDGILEPARTARPTRA
jgi:hypothetical protein